MNADDAMDITVRDRLSKGLEYGSYLVILLAAVAMFQGRYVIGAVLIGGGVLAYQTSQYRLAITALQKRLQ